jgi:hypothetical protein
MSTSHRAPRLGSTMVTCMGSRGRLIEQHVSSPAGSMRCQIGQHDVEQRAHRLVVRLHHVHAGAVRLGLHAHLARRCCNSHRACILAPAQIAGRSALRSLCTQPTSTSATAAALN